jgi:hypothetical protein
MYWICIGTVAAIPVCYVCSLYLFDCHQYHTDHPLTIKKRVLGVCLSSSAICAWTYFLVSRYNNDPAKLMGLFVDENAIWNTIKAVGITASIYLGSFLMSFFDGSMRSWFCKLF